MIKAIGYIILTFAGAIFIYFFLWPWFNFHRVLLKCIWKLQWFVWTNPNPETKELNKGIIKGLWKEMKQYKMF